MRRPLLEAAYRVIGKKGASGLTLDAVAAEAGASKGGVLYHFRSKKALFEALLEDVIEESERELERFMEPGDEPGRFVRAYILSATKELPEEEAVMGSAILAAIAEDPSWARVYWPAVERWRERGMNDGIDPALALGLMFAADGMSIADAIGVGEGRKEIRRQTVARLVELTRKA